AAVDAGGRLRSDRGRDDEERLTRRDRRGLVGRVVLGLRGVVMTHAPPEIAGVDAVLGMSWSCRRAEHGTGEKQGVNTHVLLLILSAGPDVSSTRPGGHL